VAHNMYGRAPHVYLLDREHGFAARKRSNVWMSAILRWLKEEGDLRTRQRARQQRVKQTHTNAREVIRERFQIHTRNTRDGEQKVSPYRTHLVVHVWSVETAVRVTCHHRQTTCGSCTAHRPPVGPTVTVKADAWGQEIWVAAGSSKRSGASPQRLGSVERLATKVRSRGDRHQVVGRGAKHHARRRVWADGGGHARAQELGLVRSQKRVAHLVHGEAVPRLPRLGGLLEERVPGVVCVEHKTNRTRHSDWQRVLHWRSERAEQRSVEAMTLLFAQQWWSCVLD
jgi:hypothetical protein